MSLTKAEKSFVYIFYWFIKWCKT